MSRKSTPYSKKKKNSAGNASRSSGMKSVDRDYESAYGDKIPICMNAGCVLRKNARCLGFEGCPGFKGR